MRLPCKGGNVIIEETCRMVDYFLSEGFNYFDTAHRYLGGQSETALRECLTSRYPRDRYILTDKLTHGIFTLTQQGVLDFFEKQLEACGVEYFDFYLMHAQNSVYFEDFKNCRAYETAFELKKEGRIRHVGISFHDKAAVLDRILSEYPEIELVQIQLNYMDWEDPSIQSRLCYEVCGKHGKPVAVMEPVKGGSLVNLPKEAGQILKSLGGGSNASYALRFAAGLPCVTMTLSGMSTMEQMRENLSVMSDPKPLSEAEIKAAERTDSRTFLEKCCATSQRKTPG